MKIVKDFSHGIKSYWKAVLFIRDHKLYWYALIPALLMLGIYQIGYQLKQHHFVADSSTMNGIVWYLLQLLIEISIAMLFMQFSKYLVVTLLSPLLAYLSMKVEVIITQKKYPFNLHQFWIDIRRGVQIVVRNMMWQYFFFLIIFAICAVFWDDVSQSPLMLTTYLIGFYYYGFSFLDYINERRKLSVDESIVLMRKYRGLTIAIGTIYSLLILVPVNLDALFNWSQFNKEPIAVFSQFFVHAFLWGCAAFAPILATVASTIAVQEIVDDPLYLKNEPQ